MKGLLFILIIIITISFSACFLINRESSAKLPEKVSYNFHIRPILSDKCFKCHGPDVSKLEAGLRLDLPELAFRELKETKGAYALVPGKPGESELFKRISSTDSSYMMPVPESHLGALTAYAIGLVEQLIKQRAKYEPHCALIKPQKAPLPQLEKKEWPKKEIDYFTLQKLQETGLSPNEQESKQHLLKRVSLDVT